jgi:glycine cleavage system H protein
MNAEVLKYTKNHVWVHVDGDKAVVGLSDYAQQELGDIVFVEMPQQGTKVKKDESMGTVESVKSVSDIFSPLAGEIVDFNKVLEDTPETINKDPFGEGWIVKIKIENAGEIDTLMDFAAYTEFTESER